MAAIGYSKETSRLVIGDNEGCVKVYGASLDKIVEYNLADLVDSVKPRDLGVASIRSVDIFGYSDARHPVDQHGCKILVGTLSSEVYEIKGPGLETSSSKIENLHNGALVQGHFKNGQTKKDEVWGLARDPNSKNYFATAGDDNTVRIWSMGNRKMMLALPCSLMARKRARAPWRGVKPSTKKDRRSSQSVWEAMSKGRKSMLVMVALYFSWSRRSRVTAATST